MAEMTALEYLKTKNRMTKVKEDGKCTIRCRECPLGSKNNGKEISCDYFQRVFPEMAISKVQKWGEEHQQKTMLQDFLEKYPNAPKDSDGMPQFCPWSLGYRNDIELCDSSDDYKCVNCWNRPLEE